MTSLTSVLPPSIGQQHSTLLTPTSQPVPLLATPLARTYSFAYTAGVLFYYYLRAGSLVSDPLTTLLQDLIPLAFFQSLFCALCLPVAGTWNSGTGEHSGKFVNSSVGPGKKAASITSAGNAKKRVGAPAYSNKGAGLGRSAGERIVGGPWQSRIMPTSLSLILAVTVPPAPLAVLALVLGAPLYPTNLIPHTFALSVHVALFAFLPIFYTHGVSAGAWRDVAAAWLPFDEAGVWGGAVGTMVGGWIGAVPIALDWDREWQKWPCTVVWGAVLGWSVGRLLTTGLKLGVGSRISFSVTSSTQEQVQGAGGASINDGKKEA